MSNGIDSILHATCNIIEVALLLLDQLPFDGIERNLQLVNFHFMRLFVAADVCFQGAGSAKAFTTQLALPLGAALLPGRLPAAPSLALVL